MSMDVFILGALIYKDIVTSRSGQAEISTPISSFNTTLQNELRKVIVMETNMTAKAGASTVNALKGGQKRKSQNVLSSSVI